MSGLLSAGGPAVELKTIGDRFRGVVLSVSELTDRDPATGKDKHWDNGDPVKVYAVNCEPERPQDFEGEDVVTLWVRSGLIKAFRDAAKTARVRNMDTLRGALIDVVHTGLGKPPSKGLNAPKLYEVTLTPGFRAMGPADSDDLPPEEPF